jgi:glycosyltransferase involved in cell wall biosynthesis
MRKSANVLRIPIIVDVSSFPSLESTGSYRTICYCGNLNLLVELENLLDIFAQISTRYRDVVLKIVGDIEKSPYKMTVRDIIVRRNLQEVISFTGPVAHSHIASEFATANILVLPRPSGLFSSAGFPTKLGEYLATGKPVITTKTGDIPLFLTHGVDAYLVDPDDNEAFVEALSHALDDPLEAKAIGIRGRETCLKHFSADINVTSMVTHFCKIICCQGAAL